MDIQVGDRVTYRYTRGENKNITTDIINSLQIRDYLLESTEKGTIEILKIERPHYEVVEEKKELLTEEEKEFLKSILRYYKATTIYFDVDRVLFFDDIIEEISPNYPKGLKFEGVKKHTQYDLEELGLE